MNNYKILFLIQIMNLIFYDFYFVGDWSVVVTPSTDYTPHVITAEPGEVKCSVIY